MNRLLDRLGKLEDTLNNQKPSEVMHFVFIGVSIDCKAKRHTPQKNGCICKVAVPIPVNNYRAKER